MRPFRLFNLTLLLLFSLAVSSCERPAPLPNQESIAVTYDTIAGCWQLTHLEGAPLSDETELYIAFDNTEHTFVMWDNLNSMYLRETTGRYSITAEEDGTYTLSGSYDNGVGKWSNDYRIELTNEGLGMKWHTLSESHEVMDFVFIGDLPDNINN